MVKVRRYHLFLVVAGVLFGFTSLILWYWERPPVSPLIEGSVFRFIVPPQASNNKVIYGFLPYWNLSKTTLQDELTHLAYFSLTISGDGSLLLRDGTATEPGYHKLQSDQFLEFATQAKQQNTQLDLVLTQMNNADIEAFLASPTAQDKLISQLHNILLAYPFSGINIDIEYVGSSSPTLRSQMTQFMQRLNQQLDQKYDHVELSIDVYAGAAKSTQIWDVAALSQEVDYMIVMAYDFHRRSSSQAGPVAPLFGGKKYWQSDISEHLKEFLKVVPPEKILLGIPFYGYEWQTTSDDPQALTFPNTGSTASYERVQELLGQALELTLKQDWNEDALSPYLSYQKDGETFVVYYEDSRSISYKLDYVNQLNLGGIAIWALGYEGNSRELWDVIHAKLRAS